MLSLGTFSKLKNLRSFFLFGFQLESLWGILFPCGTVYSFHIQKYRGLSQFMKLLNRDGKWKNKLYCHGIVLATFCLWVVDPDLTLNNL